MELLDFKDLYKHALNSENGGIMTIVEVWENVPNFLMKGFRIVVSPCGKSLVFSPWKVRKEREDKKKISMASVYQTVFHNFSFRYLV